MNKTFWFIFYKSDYLLKKETSGYALPEGSSPIVEMLSNKTVHHIHTEGDTTYKSIYLDKKPREPKGYEWIDLRASYEKIEDNIYYLAGKAFQITFFDRTNQFCSICGTKLKQRKEIMKKCPKCLNEVFPKISPAVIVRIDKDDKILLVHARNFKGNFKGLVAGFLEPGETLEECVYREVKEETQLKIKNLKYFGNQPWPYPSGLMVGFTAEYESGTLKLQDEELESGDFFDKENLPIIPRKLSLARKLIDAWLDKQ